MLAEAALQAPHQASLELWLPTALGLADVTEPFPFRWLSLVDWRIETSEMEGTCAAVATQQFPITTARRTVVYVLSLESDISHESMLTELKLVAGYARIQGTIR